MQRSLRWSLVLLLLVACDRRPNHPRPPSELERDGSSSRAAAPHGASSPAVFGRLRPVARAPVSEGANAVLWGADDRTLYIGRQGAVLSWDPSADAPPRPWLETGVAVEALARDPEGTVLAWAGGTVSVVVDASSKAEQHRFEHEDLVAALAVDDTQVLAIDMRNTAHAYDFRVRRSRPDREVDTLHALSVAGIADGSLLAMGGYGSIDVVGLGIGFTIEMPRCAEEPNDPACVHWEQVEVEEFGDEGLPPSSHGTTAPRWFVHAVTFAPDGRTLAAGRADGVVLVMSVPDGVVTQRFETDPEGALSVGYAPDGSLLAVGGFGGRVDVIRVGDGAMSTVAGHAHRVEGVAFSGDGRLATASYDGVRVWALEP